jgi:hypothetical protein
MKKIEAHIESNGKSWYSVYTNHEFPFGVFGEGASAVEAKNDFLNVFAEMCKSHKARTGDVVSAEFEFVYDMSAILQECKQYISFAWLAKTTGINKTLLSQYACGTRKPRPAQKERIISGIHKIGEECLAVGLNK